MKQQLFNWSGTEDYKRGFADGFKGRKEKGYKSLSYHRGYKHGRKRRDLDVK